MTDPSIHPEQLFADPRAADAAPTPEPRLIEVGWLVVGALDEVDRQAVAVARQRALDELRRSFPSFEWEMPLLERRDLVQEVREEPVTLLDYGRGERDARRWDFALVVTGADLVAHEKPYALAVPSRALGVGVISTVRIDPKVSGRPRLAPAASRARIANRARVAARAQAASAASAGSSAPHAGPSPDASPPPDPGPSHAAGPSPTPSATPIPDSDRTEIVARRVFALALHLLGHLNGLDHSGSPECVMHAPSGVTDLDQMTHFEAAEAEWLAEELADVADLRLEERRRRLAPFTFYLQAAWFNRDDIASSVRLARPWMFPLRLSRLTTAAGSALVILLLTAETWDLGMNQPPALVGGLACLVLLVTTTYVLKNQRLLVRRGSRRLTEQTVVTNISLTLVVLLGLGVTFLGLFLVALGAERLFYPPALVASWTASLGAPAVLGQYVVLAGFVASLGIVIGTLGASFEEQNYIRHIAYVDEET